MKQIVGNNNQSVQLDPEKVYFIEKFGHLLKNMNGGFSGPVHEALIQRIFSTVDQFRNDLPDFVKGLEQERLINNAKKMAAETIKRQVSKPVVVEEEKKVDEIDAEDKKEELIETEIEVKVDDPLEKVFKNESINDDSTELKPSASFKNDVEEEPVDKKTSILRPSAAAIIEENRIKQLKKIKEQKNLSEKDNGVNPLVTRPTFKPKKELTVWERAWHRYGGYTDEVMNNPS